MRIGQSQQNKMIIFKYSGLKQKLIKELMDYNNNF